MRHFIFLVVIGICTVGLSVAQDFSREDETIFEDKFIHSYTDPPVIIPPDNQSLLYDNGPPLNVPGGGSGGADLSLLESTTLGMNTLGFGNQFSLGYRMADEFTVSAGETWQIDSLVFYAYQTNGGIPSTITGVYFQIWDGDPSVGGSSVLFGDLTTNRLTNTYWANIYRASETSPTSTARAVMRNVCATSGLVLTEGTYWVDWMTDGSVSSGPWAPPIAILGNSTTGNALQYTTVWAPAFNSGTNTPQGLPFEVWGDDGETNGLMLVDDGNPDGADSVETWLNLLGFTYSRFPQTSAMSMPTSEWLTYDAVIWVGVASNNSELDSTTTYLDGNGNLLIWEADEAYWAGTSSLFLDYIMATFVGVYGSIGIITGLDMMVGITFDISSAPFANDILPNTGAFGTGVPTFLAPTTTTYAGMRGDGGSFRTALLCWDPEDGEAGITSATILSRAVNWLVYAIIPVELTSFTASAFQGNVNLNWTTATETNNSGFEIERKISNSNWERIGFVEGYGTTTEPKTYSYIDDINGIAEKSITYRLKQIDFSGNFSHSKEVLLENSGTIDYTLVQNYPNPFNPITNISYILPVKGQVQLVIFNSLGELLRILVNEEKEPGKYNIQFEAKNLPSGIYFYQLRSADFVETKKMILLR